MPRPERRDALRRDRLGDEDAHPDPRASRSGRLQRGLRRRSPRRAPAAPGFDRRGPTRSRPPRASRSRRRSRRRVTEPRWPTRKTLPASRAWPPATTSPRALEVGVERPSSRGPSGMYAAVTVRERWRRLGEQLEAERLEAGPRRRRAGDVPGEHAGLALLVHQPDALVDLEGDRDRRRPRRLAVGHRLAVPAQVEVEARHLRGLHRRPARARRGDHRQPRRGHPRLLRGGRDDVDAPARPSRTARRRGTTRCRRGSARPARRRGPPRPARRSGS